MPHCDSDAEDFELEVDCCTITDDIDRWMQSVYVSCNKGITVAHLNIRSISKHWDELKVILQNQIGNIDVIILSEVALCVDDELFNFNGYRHYYKIRKDKKGGGLILFVKQDHIFTEKDTLFDSCEHIHGTIVTKNNIHFTLLAIYRPPNCSKTRFVDELDNYLLQESRSVRNSIIIGDVNINLLDSNDSCVEAYENCIAGNGYRKCINKVTREEFRGSSLTGSCIDHLFVKGKYTNHTAAVITTKISDHYMIIGRIFTGKNIVEERNSDLSSRYSCVNEKLLKSNLNEINWKSYLSTQSADKLIEEIQEKFREENDKVTEIKVVNKVKRKNAEWMTHELLAETKIRDKLFRKWKNCRNSNENKPLYREEYKKYRNKLSKAIKNRKFKYYKERFEKSKGNIKETWQIINEFIGHKKKDTVDEVLARYLGKTKTNEEIANNFVKSFTEEIEYLKYNCDTELVNHDKDTVQLQSMYFKPVTGSEIYKYIQEMDSKKGAGIDGVRVVDIKYLSKVMCHLISQFINLSINAGQLPKCLKLSIIRPIYKKGNHLLYSNYRAIAKLPNFVKLAERSVANRLVNYLKK